MMTGDEIESEIRRRLIEEYKSGCCALAGGYAAYFRWKCHGVRLDDDELAQLFNKAIGEQEIISDRYSDCYAYNECYSDGVDEVWQRYSCYDNDRFRYGYLDVILADVKRECRMRKNGESECINLK